MNKFILGMLALPIFIGCHSHEHGDHDHSDTTAHLEPVSHTIWTTKSELFVEFNPLVVGQNTSFAAHFSDMKNFKAVTKGTVKVTLSNKDESLTNTVISPLSPGIFRPTITPEKPGVYKLIFDIETETYTDQVIIDSITVFPNESIALENSQAENNANEITFLKEQAWKIDFAIQKVNRKNIHKIIKTSGQIEPMQGDEIMITAKSNGVVIFNQRNSLAGIVVGANQNLFTISGSGNIDDNIESKFAIAKAEYEKSKASFERGKELIKEKIISPQEYEEHKVKFEISKTNYENIISNYGKDGQLIKSPFSGFLKNILVREGQYVKSGDLLAVVSKNQKLIIKADVSQKYFKELPNINSANFRTASDQKIYQLEDFNGKLLSFGKNISNGANYLPIYFEIDNKGQLLSGSFIEVFLKTNAVKSALVIPRAAVMNDYESYFVFVQTSGESFEKREVKLGIDNGVDVQVLSGINEGEWVVTTGAFQVKMASMSSTIPAHGHSH